MKSCLSTVEDASELYYTYSQILLLKINNPHQFYTSVFQVKEVERLNAVEIGTLLSSQLLELICVQIRKVVKRNEKKSEEIKWSHLGQAAKL